MQQLDTKRHDAIFDKEAFQLPVHIVGNGGVGSHVAYMLAKLGVGVKSEVHLYDGDVIEPHNIANQAYDLAHVGQNKTLALAEVYNRLSGGNARVCAHPSFVTSQGRFSGIVFLCLDSMQARKDICQSSLWQKKDVALLIDPRMDAATAVAFTIDPNNSDHIERWEERWFPDDEAENAEGCSGHLSVVTACALTAAIAVQQFIGFASKQNGRMANYVRLSLGTWEQTVENWLDADTPIA